MKCSCELRFWVRKAISHLFPQQLSRKSGSCLPLQCLHPSALTHQSRGLGGGQQYCCCQRQVARAGGSRLETKPRGAPWGLRGGSGEQLAGVLREIGRLFFPSF